MMPLAVFCARILDSRRNHPPGSDIDGAVKVGVEIRLLDLASDSTDTLPPHIPFPQVLLDRTNTLKVFGVMLVGLSFAETVRISFPSSLFATLILRLTGALARTYEVHHAR